MSRLKNSTVFEKHHTFKKPCPKMEYGNMDNDHSWLYSWKLQSKLNATKKNYDSKGNFGINMQVCLKMKLWSKTKLHFQKKNAAEYGIAAKNAISCHIDYKCLILSSI